ncbi:MAG: hypothetical protein B6I29_02385 [Marinitoga sp. 4572_148]|nr:MAG: hypothetical protein B6I29_02385 [Marinitoga sp. 4572_148]
MEETYEKILKAAFIVFSKEGYQKASVNKIIKAAGVSKGALYHYFKSKEELYLQVIEFYFRAMIEEIKKVDFSDIEILKEMGLINIKNYRRNQNTQKFTIDFFLQAMLNKKVRKKMNEYLNIFIQILKEKLESEKQKNIIKKDVDTGILAQKIFIMLDSLGMYISLETEVIEPEKIWIDFIENNILKCYTEG